MKHRCTHMWLLAATFFSSACLDQVFFANIAFAENQATPIAEMASSMGKVWVLRDGDRIACVKGMKLFGSDQIVTGSNSVAKILFADGSNFVVLQEGSVEVEAYWTEAHGTKTTINSMFNIVRGKARFFFKPREGGHEGYVKTANAIMGVRGTTFYVDTGSSNTSAAPEKRKTELIVLTGVVSVQNPKKPEAEVFVKANETTVVAGETTQPTPPAPVKEADVVALDNQVSTLPERIPDGQPAKEIDLPPPTMPSEKNQIRGNDVHVERSTIIKQIITPQYMVIPTNAVVASKAGISCDNTSFDKFRLAAQNMSTDAPLMGSELVQCPGLQSETVFWLGFHHLARGENARAAELPHMLRSKNVPLDVRTEKNKLIQAALEGEPKELAKAVQAKNSALAQDTEVMLTLARAYTLIGQHDEAQKYFTASQNISRLASNLDSKIEQGYALLLKGDYEAALNLFTRLRSENLDSYQTKAIEHGMSIAEHKKVNLSGSEKDFLRLSIENASDQSDWNKGGPAFYWQSRNANVVARTGNVSLRNNPGQSNSQGTHFGELLLGRNFNLSSGTEIEGLAGLSQLGEKIDLEANILGGYRFGNRIAVGVGFARQPVAFTRLVPTYANNWAMQTFSVYSNYKRILDDRNLVEGIFEFSTVSSYDSIVSGTASGRVPVHNGRTTSDFLYLKADAGYRSHSANMLEYESPKAEFRYGAGFEWGWKPFSWGNVGAAASAGFVSRQKRTDAPQQTVAERDLYRTSDAEKRKSVENESYTRIQPYAEYTPWPVLKLFFKVDAQNFKNTANGDQTWKETHLELGLQWNYNAGVP